MKYDLNMPETEMIKLMISNGEIKPSRKKRLDDKERAGFRELTAVQKYSFTKAYADALGIVFNNESLFYVINEKKRIVISKATAGAGKTTMTEFRMIKEILLSGVNPRSMIFLSFNDDSVRDLRIKYDEMMNTCNMTLRNLGIYCPNELRPSIRSLNSLTYNTLDQFKSLFNMTKIDIIDEMSSLMLFESILNDYSTEEYCNVTVNGELCRQFKATYELCVETMMSLEELDRKSVV